MVKVGKFFLIGFFRADESQYVFCLSGFLSHWKPLLGGFRDSAFLSSNQVEACDV